jgi:hypothetical protein
MQHYTVSEVEGWAVDAALLGGVITNEMHKRFVALVKQANEAHAAQLRYERALGQMLGGAVMDLGRVDRDTL